MGPHRAPTRTKRKSAAPILNDRSIRRFAIIGGAGLLGCIVSRAPTILGKISVPVLNVEFAPNAGYVVLFGPVALLAGIFWACYGASYSGEPRNHWGKVDWTFAAFLLLLPFLSTTFLALQFFLLLAPKGECLTFDRFRYLTDASLKAFQPEYCIGLPVETGAQLPWIIQPPILWGWVQLLAPVIALALTAWAWRRWSS